MKKILVILVAVISFFLFSSFGDNEKTLSVSNVAISGELGKYVKVVDGNYILKHLKGVKDIAFSNKTLGISVKFELVNKIYDEKLLQHLLYVTYIYPVDSKGMRVEIPYKEYFQFELLDSNILEELLQGKVGDTADLLFIWRWSNKDHLNKIMTETTNFEVVSRYKSVNKTVSPTPNTTDSIVSSAKIDSVWVEQDVDVNGEKGMVIHFKLQADIPLNNRVCCSASFFQKDGKTSLKDNNDKEISEDKITCYSDLAKDDVYHYFVPLSLFSNANLSKGSQDLTFRIVIFDDSVVKDVSKFEILTYSIPVSFRYTKQ